MTEHDLTHLKQNAEDDYADVPPSVHSYITALEGSINGCFIPNAAVVGKELRIYTEWLKRIGIFDGCSAVIVKEYLHTLTVANHMKDREASVLWWRSLNEHERSQLSSKYIAQVPASLTGAEIEMIWRHYFLSK